MSLAKKHRAQLRSPKDKNPFLEDTAEPYYRVPATPESYDAQRNVLAKMLHAHYNKNCSPVTRLNWRFNQDYFEEKAILALAVLGINAPQPARKERK